MTRSIEVDQRTFEAIALAARAKDVTPGEIVGWLVRECSIPMHGPRPAPSDADGAPVVANYRGVPTEARFNVQTRRILITSGVLSGRRFDSPSGAAMAVVVKINPEMRRPETNGWKFWRLVDTGEPIETLRRLPAALPNSPTAANETSGPTSLLMAALRANGVGSAGR